MIGLPGSVKIYLASGPSDLRTQCTDGPETTTTFSRTVILAVETECEERRRWRRNEGTRKLESSWAEVL
jgi:hypothetical protein